VRPRDFRHHARGKIDIKIGDGYAIEMTGSVTKVSDGVIAKEMFGASVAV